MPKTTKMSRMSEDEYLRSEETARVRHEYVDGWVFAMTGSTDAHNVICGNMFSFIHSHLRGGPCRAYMNDMKVRIESGKRYYYPDIMVSCEPFDAKSVCKIEPVLIIEVLSPSTAQTDRREKLIAYQNISSLKEYVIVYQDRQRVDLYRRESNDQWERTELNKTDELVFESLSNQALSLPFSIIYEGYNPPSRVKESEIMYEPQLVTISIDD